jgi:hypothetical protein
MTNRDERVRDEHGKFTTATDADEAVPGRTPEQRHTAIVIGTAADALAAAGVLDRLDRAPVGESVIERADLLEKATKIHDSEGCGCDRKYLMSCPRFAAAILASGQAAA